jgi:hypothetical protein
MSSESVIVGQNGLTLEEWACLAAEVCWPHDSAACLDRLMDASEAVRETDLGDGANLGQRIFLMVYGTSCCFVIEDDLDQAEQCGARKLSMEDNRVVVFLQWVMDDPISATTRVIRKAVPKRKKAARKEEGENSSKRMKAAPKRRSAKHPAFRRH